jgi:hypothetical protein
MNRRFLTSHVVWGTNRAFYMRDPNNILKILENRSEDKLLGVGENYYDFRIGSIL